MDIDKIIRFSNLDGESLELSIEIFTDLDQKLDDRITFRVEGTEVSIGIDQIDRVIETLKELKNELASQKTELISKEDE